MKTLVIFNHRAGSADRFAQVTRRFEGRSGCEIRRTSHPQDARRFGQAAVEEGFDRVVVAGGDGTVSQVVNGIAPEFSRIELAVLPLGTGNDLARSLGITIEDIDAACSAVMEGKVRKIDVVRITDGTTRYFVNAATGGFGAEVSADVNSQDKHRWGPFAYWMTAIAKLVDLHEYEVRLDLDGQTHDLTLYALALANGRFIGGGFPIAPAAELDDGLLHVTTIPVMSAVELLGVGLSFALGNSHLPGNSVTLNAHRVHIHATPDMPFSVDGEPMSSIDATFQVLPSALSVVVGDEPLALAH